MNRQSSSSLAVIASNARRAQGSEFCCCDAPARALPCSATSRQSGHQSPIHVAEFPRSTRRTGDAGPTTVPVEPHAGAQGRADLPVKDGRGGAPVATCGRMARGALFSTTTVTCAKPHLIGLSRTSRTPFDFTGLLTPKRAPHLAAFILPSPHQSGPGRRTCENLRGGASNLTPRRRIVFEGGVEGSGETWKRMQEDARPEDRPAGHRARGRPGQGASAPA
jgi:hypothetical protein